MSRTALLQIFPNLDPAQFVLASPKTPAYNCIAFAAGDHSRWWWPDVDGINYWPEGVMRRNHLSVFQSAFETLGYCLCANGGWERPLEKVAIFGDLSGSPTHAARQLECGTWVSKLGESEDVRHDLVGLEGAAYGRVAFFMSREWSAATA